MTFLYTTGQYTVVKWPCLCSVTWHFLPVNYLATWWDTPIEEALPSCCPWLVLTYAAYYCLLMVCWCDHCLSILSLYVCYGQAYISGNSPIWCSWGGGGGGYPKIWWGWGVLTQKYMGDSAVAVWPNNNLCLKRQQNTVGNHKKNMPKTPKKTKPGPSSSGKVVKATQLSRFWPWK